MDSSALDLRMLRWLEQLIYIIPNGDSLVIYDGGK